MKKIVFFTGAGVSVESGIPAFRDRLGLWKTNNPEEIASIKFWKINNVNKLNMLTFHNQFRRQIINSQPNAMHEYIASLQVNYDVTVVTQNVDNFHERAGNLSVLHLHGNIMESRSSLNPKLVYPCISDINKGDKCEKGSQLRPNVVWFGEELKVQDLNIAKEKISNCDILIVIGTSLNVSPANELINYLPQSTKLLVIDPNVKEIGIKRFNTKYFNLSATEAICELDDALKDL